MKASTGLLGRDDLVETVAREARKGRHLLLTGPVGIGKSAVLEAALDRLLLRQHLTLLHLTKHQAKGQFLELARAATGGVGFGPLAGPVGAGTIRRQRGSPLTLGTHVAFASVLYLGGAMLFGYKPNWIGWLLAAVASLLPDIDFYSCGF
ncbi:MAG TPA: hypothetical protein P5552_14425 [Candidatus Competibacteraceae bacterium]|nr:hypothetical protein [Candidatus Competibacteraceae bacterium]